MRTAASVEKRATSTAAPPATIEDLDTRRGCAVATSSALDSYFLTTRSSTEQPDATAVQRPHSVGQSYCTMTAAASQGLDSCCATFSLTHTIRSLHVAFVPPCSQVCLHAASAESVVVRVF